MRENDPKSLRTETVQMTYLASHRLARTLACLTLVLLACFALVLIALPAGAQEKGQPTKQEVLAEPTVTSATYGDWVLRCVAVPSDAKAGTAEKAGRARDKNCEVAQTVQVQGQQQPLAQLAIARLPEKNALTLTTVVPVNVSLPGLIHVSGNGKTGDDEKGGVDLAWKACVGGGCIANAQISDKIVADWAQQQQQGHLRFADASASAIAIPLSWKGLEQAVNALNKAMPAGR